MTEKRDAAATGASEAQPDAKRQAIDGLTNGAFADALNEIQKVQDKLQQIDDECVKKQVAIQKEFDVKKRPLIEARQKMIEQVPGFWGTALGSHVALRSAVPMDKEILKHLVGIDLEDNLDDAGSYKIKFNFGPEASAFFEPLEISKHVEFPPTSDGTGQTKFVTKITFKQGKDPREEAERMREEGSPDSWSIFEWFSENVDEESDALLDLGEVIRRHFWHTPLNWFMGDDDDDDDDDDEDPDVEEPDVEEPDVEEPDVEDPDGEDPENAEDDSKDSVAA